jgi:hypothetical protein
LTAFAAWPVKSARPPHKKPVAIRMKESNPKTRVCHEISGCRRDGARALRLSVRFYRVIQTGEIGAFLMHHQDCLDVFDVRFEGFQLG